MNSLKLKALKMREDYDLMSNSERRSLRNKKLKTFKLSYDTSITVTKASKRDLYQKKEDEEHP